MTETRTIKEIVQYFHCCECIQELDAAEVSGSPREYQEIEVGWTDRGLQVWCKRHERNVVHLDFGGKKCNAA